jgi:tight adherence protein B
VNPLVLLGIVAILLAAGLTVAPRWTLTHRAAGLLGTREALAVRAALRLHGNAGARLERRRSAARRRETAVLGFVEALVAELGAGLAVPAAVRAAAARHPRDPVLRAVARHVELGGDPVTAVATAADRPGAAGLWAVAVCLQVSTRSGAGLGEALRPVAGALRDEQDLAREVAGQLAAPRATARLLAALPLVVWLLGAGLGADPVRVLIASPYGWACLVLGGALELAGLKWVDRMARAVTAG